MASNREVKQHILKCWPYFFQPILSGRKGFEVRDCSEAHRDFQVGDTLRLVEWDAGAEAYTGRALECRVSYIMPGGRFGLPLHLCVMSLADVKESHVHIPGETP